MPSQHKHPTRTFRPKDIAVYNRAMEVLKGAGLTMDGYLNMCLEYLTGEREDFPRRPQQGPAAAERPAREGTED